VDPDSPLENLLEGMVIEENGQQHRVKNLFSFVYYPLANEVAKGYSNATVRPSVRPSVLP